MFRLPDRIPTHRSPAQEWADFAEIKTLLNNEIAILTAIKGPMVIADEIQVNGTEDESDQYIARADDIASEVKYRTRILGAGYPFILDGKDYVLKIKDDLTHVNNLYLYLLLATRLNMTAQKVFNGLDGTKLFEKLSAEVANQYFGNESKARILGTAENDVGGFRQKLKRIFTEIGESTDIHQHDNYKAQDDKIDVVVWRSFKDGLPSQIIGFGQCKTGTSWVDSLGQLEPSTFCRRWFTTHPIITPIKIFFCAQYFPKETWQARAYDAGLIFDRFRIISALHADIDEDLQRDIDIWRTEGTDWIQQNFNRL